MFISLIHIFLRTLRLCPNAVALSRPLHPPSVSPLQPFFTISVTHICAHRQSMLITSTNSHPNYIEVRGE